MMIGYLVIAILIVIIIVQFKQTNKLRTKLTELVSRKQSLSTTYGQIFEQLIPFSKKFPYETKKFRFIGDPIDGIIFDEDKIVFCEIKMNKSKLNKKQNNIKELVKRKKVEWFEMKGE